MSERERERERGREGGREGGREREGSRIVMYSIKYYIVIRIHKPAITYVSSSHALLIHMHVYACCFVHVH